jgi:hypothetical protein
MDEFISQRSQAKNTESLDRTPLKSVIDQILEKNEYSEIAKLLSKYSSEAKQVIIRACVYGGSAVPIGFITSLYEPENLTAEEKEEMETRLYNSVALFADTQKINEEEIKNLFHHYDENAVAKEIEVNTPSYIGEKDAIIYKVENNGGETLYIINPKYQEQLISIGDYLE